MPLKIKKTALQPEIVLEQLVVSHGRNVTATVAALTDSSGGTAGALAPASTALVNVANAATNLAGKATTDAALVTVTDALRELYAKSNEYATKLGLDLLTYNGGGASTDGTVAAVTVSTTAATTGVQAASMNTAFGEINTAVASLTNQINAVANALGYAKVANLTGITHSNTIAAITVSGGTAADPGVTKVAVDAELVKIRTNIATLAAKLNTFRAGNTAALVVLT